LTPKQPISGNTAKNSDHKPFRFPLRKAERGAIPRQIEGAVGFTQRVSTATTHTGRGFWVNSDGFSHQKQQIAKKKIS